MQTSEELRKEALKYAIQHPEVSNLGTGILCEYWLSVRLAEALKELEELKSRKTTNA